MCLILSALILLPLVFHTKWKDKAHMQPYPHYRDDHFQLEH